MDTDVLYQDTPVRLSRFKIIALVLGILIIVFSILAMTLSGSSVSPHVKQISALSSEISRIADLAIASDSADSANRYLASTIKAVYSSYVAQLQGLPGGSSVSKQELADAKDESADILLEEAGQLNQFNETFREIMAAKFQAILPEAEKLFDKAEAGVDKAVAEGLLSDSQLFYDLLSGTVSQAP
jgi:hypothetical protein